MLNIFKNKNVLIEYLKKFLLDNEVFNSLSG